MTRCDYGGSLEAIAVTVELRRNVRGDAPDEIITGYTSSDPTARGWYHLHQRNSVIAITDPNGIATVELR